MHPPRKSESFTNRINYLPVHATSATLHSIPRIKLANQVLLLTRAWQDFSYAFGTTAWT